MNKKIKFNFVFSLIFSVTVFFGGTNMIFAANPKLKTPGMKKLAGDWVNVYYEKEESAAEDVFCFADSNTEAIARRLGFSEKQDVNIYVYDEQSVMQTKKHGLWGMADELSWYIGDNIGTDVILTSPANPGKIHDYCTVKEAVLHEIVHAYVSVLNKDISLWLTEGVALHLSNGEPFRKSYLEFYKIPTYEETCTTNPIQFAKIGGYIFANNYIEYLEETYGWEKVLELIKTEDYVRVLGRTHREIYGDWVEFLQNYSR